MSSAGAIYASAAVAVAVLALLALPFSTVRRMWHRGWWPRFEEPPRPSASMSQLLTVMSAVLVAFIVWLIARDGWRALRPEVAAPSEYYVSLGAILLASILLIVAAARHQRRRRIGLLQEPEEDAATNQFADSARIPALAVVGLAALAGILFLVPWPNGVDRYEGAAYEEQTAPTPGLVDLTEQTPVRVDDLGDGRIRINYLGYNYAEYQCDRLASAVIQEGPAAVSISVQTGHESGIVDVCRLARSIWVDGRLDQSVQFYFEEQLQAPLGDRSLVLLP